MAPLGFTPLTSPPSLFIFIQIHLNLQNTSNSYNSSTISPNELILFALCSLLRNLVAHQRWDFSELFRISGEFQKCSWYFIFVFKIIFRRWGLSWGSPGGLWTSSALRQATATFSWCHFNICDFLTWMKWLIHAFKELLSYLYSVKCWIVVMLDLQNSWNYFSGESKLRYDVRNNFVMHVSSYLSMFLPP